MSTQVPTKTREPSGAGAALYALMRRLDRDDAASRSLIGELLEAGPGIFCDAAVEVLKTAGDSRVFQCVIATLVSQGLLLPVLCNPSLNHEQVLAAARAAQHADPMADATIAKSLADGVISGDRSVRPKDAARLLEVLSEISDGSRILPSLMRLMRHPNPHLRSKAVKMIGRGSRSVKWIRARLAEPDPRVRANAIESLWGVNTEEARELLLPRVHDSDNRVVGNALVALHRIGDCSTLPDFYKLASHNAPRFRSTAAWAMGETGDPRFSELLARLLSDSNPQVRAHALTSLSRIKSAVSRVRQQRPWCVAGSVQDDLKRNVRRLQLAVATEDGRGYPVIPGTQFWVTENGQPVVAYRARERPAPDAMSVSFVFPRTGAATPAAWVQAALSCRRWKRPSDLWGLQPYIPPEETEKADDPHHSWLNRVIIPSEENMEGDGSAEDPPHLTASLETIEDSFNQPLKRSQCCSFWGAIQQAVRSEHTGTRGKRHAIAFSCFRTIAPAGGEILSARAGGSQIHLISDVPNPVLEEFCRRVHGSFHLAESPAEVAECIRSGYLSLLARYEIAYAPVCRDSRDVKVRVQTATGWGEATIRVPRSGDPPDGSIPATDQRE